jgi:hypothetical protein
LNETPGDRWTHEDQTAKFVGDQGLEYVHESAGIKLLWGGAERVRARREHPSEGGHGPDR